MTLDSVAEFLRATLCTLFARPKTTSCHGPEFSSVSPSYPSGTGAQIRWRSASMIRTGTCCFLNCVHYSSCRCSFSETCEQRRTGSSNRLWLSRQTGLISSGVTRNSGAPAQYSPPSLAKGLPHSTPSFPVILFVILSLAPSSPLHPSLLFPC